MNYIKEFSTKSKEAQKREIDDLISNNYHVLIDTEEAGSEIASTNATGWACEEYWDVEFQIEDTCISITFAWSASGDQDQDSGYNGSTLSGSASASVDDEGNISFDEVSAEVDRDS